MTNRQEDLLIFAATIGLARGGGLMENTWVLWGSKACYLNGIPIKLSSGNLSHCRMAQRAREREGSWLLAIYKAGTEPIGLRLQAGPQSD